jgi:hypothetical protein
MKPLFVTDMFVLFNADFISNMRFGSRITFGLSGAVLMDLAVHKKIELKGKKVLLIDTSTTEDPFLDEAIAVLSSLKKNKRIRYYLNRFLHTGVNLFPLFIDRLEHLDFMKISFSEMSAFTKSFMYFTVTYVNNDIREAVIDKLKDVLLENQTVPNKAIWYLISLLRATNRYRHFFGKEYRSQVKSKIKEIIVDEPIGNSVKWAIRDAESSDSGSGD